MKKTKSSISKVDDYEKIGEFWDKHELTEFWDRTEPADFEVKLQSRVTYYAIDKEISNKIRSLAKQRGISAEALINLLIQKELQEKEM